MYRKKYVTGIFRLYSVDIDLPETQIQRLNDKYKFFVVESVQTIAERPLNDGEYNIYLLFELRFSLSKGILQLFGSMLGRGLKTLKNGIFSKKRRKFLKKR